MVAAGVYLVGRIYPIFTPDALLVIAYTGAITLFVAATIAIVMTDIKKVLAYSTVSQLGYMMLALGVGGWAAGLFHLITHAFFKALLFLGSGSVIYGCHHEQDMRKMGGLLRKLPITGFAMLAGVLAIMGFPLFTGWYSKDAIIASAMGYVAVHREHMLLFLLPLLTAGITTFYMFRMWFLTFLGQPQDPHVYEHAHESPRLMTIPLILLAACSVAAAWGWPVWKAEESALEHHLHHSQHHAVVADFGHAEGDWWEGHALDHERQFEGVRHQAHELHGLAGALALGAAGLGFVFASLLYWRRVLDPAEAQERYPGVHRFLSHKWYFDELYSVLLVRPSLMVARGFRWFDAVVIDGAVNGLGRCTVGLAKWDGLFDKTIIDGLANLTARVIQATGRWLRTWQTGSLRSYVLFLALAVIGLFVLLRYLATAAAAM
jgi:NADH-quinone oxidoreductase subunit L